MRWTGPEYGKHVVEARAAFAGVGHLAHLTAHWAQAAAFAAAVGTGKAGRSHYCTAVDTGSPWCTMHDEALRVSPASRVCVRS
jgi:hypothetical protein